MFYKHVYLSLLLFSVQVRVYKRGENTSSGITSLASGSSGIDSEIFSAYDGGDGPPTKVYLSENGKGERVKIEMRVPEKMVSYWIDMLFLAQLNTDAN